MISGQTHMGGVKSEYGLVLVSILAMPSRPGTAGQIMSAMGAEDLNIEFIAAVVGMADRDNVVFCVKEEQADQAMAIIEHMQGKMQADMISRRDQVGLVFTFGPEFRHIPGTAGQVFELLGEANINILAISTSMAVVTCVIEHDHIADAEAVLKTVFATP